MKRYFFLFFAFFLFRTFAASKFRCHFSLISHPIIFFTYMKNINTENKSAEVLARQNQLKSLAVEFMAIKEEIAATAVAKFVLKPSVNEAQNLLRIAKIFTSKSIAKFSEQLSKAKSIYDLAVSKVKDISKQFIADCASQIIYA
jgi:hypothetical protein